MASLSKEDIKCAQWSDLWIWIWLQIHRTNKFSNSFTLLGAIGDIFGLGRLSFISSSSLATCQFYFCSLLLMRIYLLEFIFFCLTSRWWLINKFKLYYNVNNVSSLIFTIFRTRHHNGRSIVIIIHVNIYLNGNLGDTLIVFLSSRLIISPESATPSPDHTRSLICLGVMNLTAITSI